MQIERGLIIDMPWIQKILDGSKSWEMRSRATTVRGDVALIKSRSKAIFAVATLTDSQGPLDREQRLSHLDKHQIPADMIVSGAVDKWPHAWIFENVRVLQRPVPYVHPQGAVIWVNLDAQARAELGMAAYKAV